MILKEKPFVPSKTKVQNCGSEDPKNSDIPKAEEGRNVPNFRIPCFSEL